MEALEGLEPAIQGILRENISSIKAQFENERRSRTLLDHNYIDR